VLTLLLVGTLTAFSQKGTLNEKDSVCFSITTAKKIAKDLLSGDSAKAELKLTEEQLFLTEKKVNLKDSIIDIMNIKITNCETIVQKEREKFVIVEGYSKKLEFELKKQTVKNKIKNYIGGGLLGIITLLIILK